MILDIRNFHKTIIENVVGVISFIKSLPQKITAVFAGAGDWLVSAGRAIIDGLFHGLKFSFEKVKGFIQDITRWIALNKGPLPYDRRLLIPAGRALMSGLNHGIRSEFGNVAKTVQGITRDLPQLAMPVHATPINPGRATAPALFGENGRGDHTVQHNRTTTVNAPINVHTASADPARVARRAADRVARLTVI